MSQTIQKNIRVTPEQRNGIEKAARKHEISPNRLIVSLVISAFQKSLYQSHGLINLYWRSGSRSVPGKNEVYADFA